MLSQNDLKTLESRGISLDEVQWQLEFLRSSRVYRELIRPATVGDGIIKADPSVSDRWKEIFRSKGKELRIEKFVPASGAATRMFKDLFAAMDDPHSNNKAKEFFDNRFKFAFFPFGKDFSNQEEWLNETLSKEKMNLGDLPKAFIPFHSKQGESVTPLQSHVQEFFSLISDGKGEVHFTFSPEHIHRAEEILRQLISTNGPVSWKVSWQYPSTDTIAIDESGDLIRDEQGNILFRPGGHGSLLKNLNELTGDLAFVRNIDNVQPFWNNASHLETSEMIGGALLDIQSLVFSALEQLSKGADRPDEGLLEKLRDLGLYSENISRQEWIAYLDRPIRVAGMVINKGEPGGGPFWIRDKKGGAILQIVESSEISPEQLSLLSAGTHFNPVNLVFSRKRFDGSYFQDLSAFKDRSAAFVSEKSFRGKKLFALEHPGLWNGAMNDWLTVFVEIPETSFTPVKTIFDLLRPEHQII